MEMLGLSTSKENLGTLYELHSASHFAQIPAVILIRTEVAINADATLRSQQRIRTNTDVG